MTRIIPSTLRPLRLRLNGAQALRLGTPASASATTTAENSAHCRSIICPGGRRAATTYAPRSSPLPSSSVPPKPTAQNKPTPQYRPGSQYKRTATTTTSNISSSTPKPNSTSPNSTSASTSNPKPTTTAFAESQLNPVAGTPYTPPPGTGPLPDAPPAPFPSSPENAIDWSSSFHGLSTIPFSPEVAAVLMSPLPFEDVEIKPDGIIYLPEIKYRRILHQAFGPGGWGMAPRGELGVGEKVVTREYALLVHGRFIAQARGECPYFGGDDGIATAGEGCKSNALMRCCKDLGIASELWDPRYIREFKKKYAQEIWVEHVPTKKKRQVWVRKGDDPQYPYKRS